MSELQGAVAAGQLPKLQQAVEKRVAAAQSLTEKLTGLRGIETPHVQSGSVHTYWKYCLRVDSDIISGGCEAVGRELKARADFLCPPLYTKARHSCARFSKNRKTFGNSRFPVYS